MDYIIYFGITILILVFVHEFGHFIAAKMSGMRVDIFAIGFGKRLFGWNKLTGFTTGDLPKDFDGKGNTDYRLCLLPIGGYVKIAGMIDESFDTEFAEKEPKPDEFRSKPTYKKVFVISAGVIMNLLLTIAIFTGLNYYQGKQIVKSTEVGYIIEGSQADQFGFHKGDLIKEVNGKKVESWEKLIRVVFIDNMGKDVRFVIERNGAPLEITVDAAVAAPPDAQSFFLPLGETIPLISQVMDDSPAKEAGLKPGDEIISLNGVNIEITKQAIEIIRDNQQVEMPMVLLRDKDTLRTAVTPGVDGMIGIGLYDYYSGDLATIDYGFFESVKLSFVAIADNSVLTLSMIKRVFTGDVEFGRTFGGPIKIAKFAADSADRGIASFLSFLAMLSFSLAILNILPLPVLDGGHLIIILIEGAIKRELPVKIKIAIQNAGFIILLMLMVFILYNDIITL